MIVLDTTTGGVQKFRMIDPNIILNELYDYPIDIINSTNIEELSKINSDKLFCHISLIQNPNIVQYLNGLKDNGVKIIVDVDDYWEVPPTHYLYNYVKLNDFVGKTLDFLKKADYIVTSTKYLANNIKKYNNKVIVLPNSINPNEGQLQIKNIPSQKVRIGWTGGSSHLEDLKLFRNLGLYSKLKNQNIQFVLAGFDIRIRNQKGEIEVNFNKSLWKQYEEIITDKYRSLPNEYVKFLMQLDKHLHYYNEENESYRRVWTKSANKYMKIFNEIDIIIIPLLNNVFNRNKSELKLIEAGFFKKPVICSNIQQYADVISHGKNGFLVDEKRAHKDFTKYLKTLIHNPQMRIDFGENLYQYCNENFNLITNSKKRLEFYNSI